VKGITIADADDAARIEATAAAPSVAIERAWVERVYIRELQLRTSLSRGDVTVGP
jgi:hypothetical protein